MMKIYTISAFLLFTGFASIDAYQKMCYMHPQYGRQGSLHDLKAIMGKHFVYDPSKPIHYEIESQDGRKTCHVRLDTGDAARVRLFLNKLKPDAPITEELVTKLMDAHEARLKSVGLVLRDFKHYYKDITAQELLTVLNNAQE